MGMTKCQKEFLLNRKCSNIEDSVMYVCKVANLVIKIGCSNISLDDALSLDKKVYDSILPHCRCCKQ